MQSHVEVLVHHIVLPSLEGLSLDIDPVLGEVLVHDLDPHVLLQHFVLPPLKAVPLVPFEVSLQLVDGISGSHLLLLLSVDVDEPIFEFSIEIERSLIDLFVIPWYILILLYQHDWVTGDFEPLCKSVSLQPGIALDQCIPQLVDSSKLADIASSH